MHQDNFPKGDVHASLHRVAGRPEKSGDAENRAGGIPERFEFRNHVMLHPMYAYTNSVKCNHCLCVSIFKTQHHLSHTR